MRTDKLNIVGIIPTRMASSRFPGKPLAEICGIPMVGHIYFRSKMCDTLRDVYVATCDNVIRDYMESMGGKAIMTKDTHQRASDRTSEAMVKIEKITKERIDIVVMIQGDEPLIYPDMINKAVAPMIKDDSIKVVNLAGTIKTLEEFEDPNEVKLVMDKFGDVLYFSREPIPSRRKGVLDVPMFKQVPIIPFRRDYLLEYNSMRPTPLEEIESVDMMRILENGQKVRIVPTSYNTKAVDTPEDIEIVSKLMSKDRLFKLYSRISGMGLRV